MVREYMNIEEVVAIVEAVTQPVGFKGRLGYFDFSKGRSQLHIYERDPDITSIFLLSSSEMNLPESLYC